MENEYWICTDLGPFDTLVAPLDIRIVARDSPSDCTEGTPGPDNGEGWGHIVLDDALYFSGDARRMAAMDNYVGIGSTGSAKYYTIQVTDASQPLKITLVWTDYPGVAGADPAIVNDLDLDVWDPEGYQFPGNNFLGAESQTGYEHWPVAPKPRIAFLSERS